MNPILERARQIYREKEVSTVDERSFVLGFAFGVADADSVKEKIDLNTCPVCGESPESKEAICGECVIERKWHDEQIEVKEEALDLESITF